MLLRFNYATFLALAAIAGIDAFQAPAIRPRHVSAIPRSGVYDNDDFLDALKGSSGGDDVEKGEEEVSEGSSRIREMLEAAKKDQGAEPGGRAIENPFLIPPPTPQSAVGFNIENLSVEEQAAMLRQLMANQGGAAAPPTPMKMPTQEKQKRTDDAGKPLGRNRDADAIANTGDLYFAQLKRDSTVRTLARIRGEDDVADAVMEDDGIDQLNDLIVENPYLKGKKTEEKRLIDSIPGEALRPYFESDEESDEAKAGSGISYKELLKQKRSKEVNTRASDTPVESAPTMAQTKPEPAVQQPVPISSPPPVPEQLAQQPIAEAIAAGNAAESIQSQLPPIMSPPVSDPAAEHAPVEIPPPRQTTVTSHPDETRQTLRTFMGMMLKHRGGPGFGRGQLKGTEIENFENMLGEVTEMLRAESMEAAPQNIPMMTNAQAPSASLPHVAPATPSSPTPSAALSLSQVDSAIACLEGATTMYKNSPSSLKESILIALRAALVSAVDTCSQAAGIKEAADYGVAQPGSASIAQVDGAIACIEGALAMYKNSPDSVKKDVLVAFRAALVSAVSTCDNVIGDAAIPSTVQQAPLTAVAPVLTDTFTQLATETQLEQFPAETSVGIHASPSAPAAVGAEEEVEIPASMEPDANSKALEAIYNKLKSASGNGSLGLRSDLTSGEAAALIADISEMRSVLLQELEEGIPAPEPLQEESNRASEAGSSVSKYQEMLAKAKAQKEGEAM